jgi:hypothetical protein
MSLPHFYLFIFLKKMVKDLFGTCGLETLFFDILVSIRIADDT